MERLEALIDCLFSFHDASPPMLLIDGPLRPLMHAALATQIMYYDVRWRDDESSFVLRRMRDAYDVVMATPGHDAHSVFIEWGQSLTRQFHIDNCHLRNRSSHEPSEQMVAGLQGMGANVARMHAQISELAQRTISVEQQNGQLVQQNQQMMVMMQQQQQLLTQLLRQQPHPGTPADATTADPIPTASPPIIPPVIPPSAPPATAGGPPSITPLGGSPSCRMFMHAAATAAPSAGPSAIQSQGGLRDLGGQQKYDLKDLHASQFFLDCMRNAGNVPTLTDARRNPEAEAVLGALKAMSSPEELAVLSLRERDAAQQAHAVSIAASVVGHLVQRMLRAYRDAGDSRGPGRLGKGTVLVNTLERHLKQSRLNISSMAFAAWRQKPDAPIQGPMAALLLGSRKRPLEVGGSDAEEEEADVRRPVRESAQRQPDWWAESDSD